MKLKGFLIIVIIISPFKLFTHFVTGQSPSDAFSMAEKWFKEENYYQAILESKRAIFFDERFMIPGNILMSECYRKLNFYDQAIDCISRASVLEEDDSLKKELMFQKINLFLRNKEPAYALIELSQLKDISSLYFSGKKDFYLAISYFCISDFRLSQEYIVKLLGSREGYDSVFIQTLYHKAFKNQSRSHISPAILSTILPGLGQLSLGYYGDALNSFILNAFLTSVTYITASNLSVLDAALTMYPFLRRYYLSAIFNARDLSFRKRERVSARLYNELLDYVDSWN